MQRALAALTFVLTLAGTAISANATDYARALPMHFTLHYDESGVCRSPCRPWVSAVGMIKPETPRDFEQFAQRNALRGATIAFDSEGGSVLGAIALGRAIRRLDMTTTVGRPEVLSSGGERAARLSPYGDCDSMCAFVLLAGVKRFVPAGARVRVHQIWLGDRREDAMAANYSAEDLVLVQRDIGRLAQYTMEMGGSIALLEIALRIPPWEPMRALSTEELSLVRLDTASETTAAMPASASAAGAGFSTGVTRGAAITERGWGLVEKVGRPALARRHPLTREGEDIGSFDLTFACGGAPDSFVVTYAETRYGDAQYAPHALNKVEISLGGRSSALAITASSVRLRELDTFASGIVSSSSVRYFAETAGRSLTIATLGSDKSATSIRVGNAGIAGSFPQFAAACAQGAQRRSAELSKQK